MKKMKLILACGTLLLSACSTISYTEPTEGERARVRFAIVEGAKELPLDSANATVYGYSSSECDNEQEWMRLFHGFLVNSSPKRLGIELWDFHENGAKEFYVSTDKPLHLLIMGGMGSYDGVRQSTHMCGVLVNETLDPDMDYELIFSQTTRTRCQVEFNKIVEQGDTFIRQNIVTHFNNGEPVPEQCLRSFGKLRWY